MKMFITGRTSSIGGVLLKEMSERGKLVLDVAVEIGVESMIQVSTLSVLRYTQPSEIADEKRPIDRSKHKNLLLKTNMLPMNLPEKRKL